MFHGLFVTVSLVPGWRAEPLVVGDAVTYVTPARNLLEHGHFTRDTTPPFRWEPYRTPGYPAVLAASLWATGGLAAALFLAAGAAGVAAWSAARLAAEWGGPPLSRWLAGLLAGLLPNALGLSARVLTDGLFGSLFVLWLYLAWRTLESGRFHLGVAAATTGAVVQTLKPSGGLLTVLVLSVALSLRLERDVRPIAAALLLSACLPVPVWLSYRNLQDHGVFSPSLLGVETFREYCQMRFLAREKGVSEEDMMSTIRGQDRTAAAQLAQPESWYGRLYLVKRAEVVRFVRDHPLVLAGLMSSEAVRQLAAPQEFAQTTFVGTLSSAGRAAGSVLTLAFFGFAASGAWRLFRDGRPGPALLCAMVLLTFLAAGSVSRFVGGRLRFPAELACAPLAGIGLSKILRPEAT